MLVCLFFYSASEVSAETTNPWANSEYTDLSTLADILISDGFSFDAYFYSEGYTTGSDGTLGNENVCIRDDTRQVYLGRSDICANRQFADYEYIFLDQIDLSKFGQTVSPYTQDEIYSTGDLLGDTSQDWSGCYTLNQRWGGVSGGTCPTINDDINGQINYGYVQQTLTNTAAIDTALKNAGLETTGYTYSWNVKNADANYENENNPGRVDPFSVTIKVYDENNRPVFEKTYDYSYWINTWRRFSGSETFENPFDLDTIDSIQLSITGYDIGYWAGYYGPEFSEPDIRLQYRLKEDTGPSPEEILKEQMCMSDPTSDPTCPGYNDAMMAQIASTNTIDDVNSGATTGTQTASINDGSTQNFDDTTGTTEQFAEATGAVIDDGSDTGSDNGMPDPVAEATGEPDPVQEAVAEAVADPIEQVTEQATADPVEEATEKETVVETTGETKSTGSGLNATQLSALDAANNVANSAIASATGAAQVSAGIGLSETGGVSSTLTSVDPTGSTSADGGVQGGSNFEFGSSTDDSATSVSDATQTTGTSTTQGFGSSQQAGSTQSFGNTGSNSSGSNSSGSQNGATGSNNGSQSNNSFGTTDFASIGQSSQDSNPLASGGAVETNDITGEQDLATSNEAITQLAMLNDPTNPINQIINDIAANLITQAVADAEETAEESAEASVESQNAQEDALVEAALAGSDDEDAQAALLGYNPNFRAYQQPQMPGGDIYSNQGVYEDQKTYDSPRAGLFNGASDALHRKMVRQQYELGN